MKDKKTLAIVLWALLSFVLFLAAAVFGLLAGAVLIGIALAGAGAYTGYRAYVLIEPQAAINPNAPREERPAAVGGDKQSTIARMVSKGYAIDKEGDGYIQFRKPKGSVIGSLILFLIGLAMLFVLMPVGVVILAVWFISLFYSNRAKVKVVTFAD